MPDKKVMPATEPFTVPPPLLEARSLLDQVKTLGDLIRQLCQAEETFSKELDKEFNVSLPQLKCLIALENGGPMTPSQLAPCVMANPSTVTGIVDRLERKGLVRRSRSSPDRRTVSISITVPGKALLQKIPLPVHPGVLNVLEKLSARERENIIEALKILTQRP